MGDVKSKLETYETKDLRKLITGSNKKRRAEVMAEIKGMREQAREIINRKKQALLKEKIIDIKGLTKKSDKDELIKRMLANKHHSFLNVPIRQSVQEDIDDNLDMLQSDLTQLVEEYQKTQNKTILAKNVDTLYKKAKQLKLKSLEPKNEMFKQIIRDYKPKAPKRTKFNIKKNNPIVDIFGIHDVTIPPRKKASKPSGLETIKEEKKKKKIKLAKKEPETAAAVPVKEDDDIVDNWDKDVNNIALEQTNNKLTKTIKSLLNRKKISINLDSIISLDVSLTKKLMDKYPFQKVLDGYKRFIEYLDDEGRLDNKEIKKDKLQDFYMIRDGRIISNAIFKKLPNFLQDKILDEWKKQNKNTGDESGTKNTMLKKLVSTTRSHKKNGITQEGLKDFNNKVREFRKTNPSKLESQVAGVLYNYLLNNIFLGKKRIPANLNKGLEELGYEKL